MLKHHRSQRGFSLVEMIVAMAVLGIVMSFAALEFKYVVYAHLFDESHLSVEQQARVTMAKIDVLSHQASVIDLGTDVINSPPPAIIHPDATPGSTLEFTQVASLDPAALPTPNGYPQPCYNKVQIYLDDQNASGGPGRLLERVDPYAAPCPGYNYADMPRLIARNVQNFTVQQVKNSVDAYGQGYRVDLTIFNYDDNKIDQRAAATYHLSSVITPLVFGKTQ